MLVRALLMTCRQPPPRRLDRLLSLPHLLVTRVPGNRPETWKHLAAESMDVVVAEIAALPDPATHSIAAIRELPDRPEVVVLSEREDPEERARLLSAGCAAVLPLSLDDGVLKSTLASILRRAEEAHRRRVEAGDPRAARLDDLASASPAMQKMLATARKVATVDTSLLVLGETGVGKERLARAIHAEGARARGPFIALNCAAIPEALLEAELFGHVKGAFSGALRARRGYFELAHRGTLLLDEIGDLSLALQAKILRALQERTIQPVGSERAIDVDVRIIAATNRDLVAETALGRFRRDLFYRLSVVTLQIPPLRERREDIPALVHAQRERFARMLGRPVTRVSEEAMATLLAYAWPGNVRELINVMEHAVLLCAGDTITTSDLPDVTMIGVVAPPARPPEQDDTLADRTWRDVRRRSLEDLERRYVMALLRATRGRIGLAAKRAGLNPRSLFQKMRRYGLRKEEFR